MNDINLLKNEFVNALLKINTIKATELFEICYSNENSFELLEKLVVEALEVIGDGWERGNISLSQVYMSGIICERLVDQYIPQTDVMRKSDLKIAIAVLQDHHPLGKRIVYSVMRAAQFKVMDFGYGLSVEELVKKTVENQIDILLISILMLPSALKIKEVKKELVNKGSKAKIVVGGAAFTFDSDLWKTVDADAWGKNASEIVGIIERLVQGNGE